jgi:hypothetical protein
MLLNKIKKTKNRFRAYPTHQAVQTSGSTAMSQDCYTVKISYQVNQKPFVEKRLTEIPIFGSADKLKPDNDYWWDFWPLNDVSCK